MDNGAGGKNGEAEAAPSSTDAVAVSVTETTAGTAAQAEVEEEEAGTPAVADAAAARRDVGTAGAAWAEKHRRLERWRGWPSQAERTAQEAALATEVRQLEADVETLRQGSKADAKAPQSTETRVRRAVGRYRRARRLWVERKGWAMRLLEASGGDVCSPQHMATLLGCSTDADVDVSFDSTAVALPVQMLRDIGLT